MIGFLDQHSLLAQGFSNLVPRLGHNSHSHPGEAPKVSPIGVTAWEDFWGTPTPTMTLPGRVMVGEGRRKNPGDSNSTVEGSGGHSGSNTVAHQAVAMSKGAGRPAAGTLKATTAAGGREWAQGGWRVDWQSAAGYLPTMNWETMGGGGAEPLRLPNASLWPLGSGAHHSLPQMEG